MFSQLDGALRVIASGRYLRPYAGIAELEARDLESHGVPESAIVPFSLTLRSTREECIAIGELLSSRGWKRILLVTSNYHTRRSEYICERAFPQGTGIRVIAAPDAEYDPRTWWRTRSGLRIFLREFVGFRRGNLGDAPSKRADCFFRTVLAVKWPGYRVVVFANNARLLLIWHVL